MSLKGQQRGACEGLGESSLGIFLALWPGLNSSWYRSVDNHPPPTSETTRVDRRRHVEQNENHKCDRIDALMKALKLRKPWISINMWGNSRTCRLRSRGPEL